MAALRKIATLILGIAFLMYPLAMHSSQAAPSDYAGAVATTCHHTADGKFSSRDGAARADRNLDMVDGHSGSMDHHSSNTADGDPCCSVSGNLCATIVSSSPEVSQLGGTFIHEDGRPTIVPEYDLAPLPHPPKAAA